MAKQGVRMVGEKAEIQAPILANADETQGQMPDASEGFGPDGTVVEPQADITDVSAGLFGQIRVKHIARTLTALPTSPNVWSGQQADYQVGEWLKQGFDVRTVRALGYGPDGVNVMWVLEKNPAVPVSFTEAKHIVRTLTGHGADASITGFQADNLLTSYLDEGWTLKAAEPMGLDPKGGISMLWLVVR